MNPYPLDLSAVKNRALVVARGLARMIMELKGKRRLFSLRRFQHPKKTDAS